jgi:NAD kinase
MTLAPRAVLVYRRTELDELLARHGTRGQAAFYLSSRGRSLAGIESRHTLQQQALATASAAIPLDWRRGTVERADLSRFLFAPDDIIVAVGQDGLVANVAKYLDQQPVIGINPDPARNPGVLVPHPPAATGPLLATAASKSAERHIEGLTMVEAITDDAQRLLALNEVYLGQPSHQTARYTLRPPGGKQERQGSSGILVGTGTGATGWCRSAWLERGSHLSLPGPAEPALCWFVREAWPSPATATNLTEGLLTGTSELAVISESEGLVAFGDGVETDALTLSWGQQITIHAARHRLRLLR